jgi:3-keto-5-aminohexanoate cleavage enzyme
MSDNKTWLEVSLNGPWSRDRQPLIPITVKEIVEQGIACAQAGAAIIHVHSYDENTGRQKDDADTYAAIIEGIRETIDVIVYPTLPFSGSSDARKPMSAQARYQHVEELAKRGLLEWGVVDPGSTHIADLLQVAQGKEGFIYANPESHIRLGLNLAVEYNFHPGFAIYEPAFLRLGAAFERSFEKIPQPVYRFMFSSGLSFGFPPADYALEAYLKLLERESPQAPWMIAGLDVDISPLIELAVSRGGHVRVGLEDAPFQTTRTNTQWTEDAVRSITSCGSEMATAADVRAALTAASVTAA